VDLGSLETIAWDAYPNLKKMLALTEFNWIREAPTEATVVEMQTAIDLHYYSSLWREVLSFPLNDRSGFEALIAEEIELKNVVWALRLRVYYGVVADALDTRLVEVSRKGVSLAAAARAQIPFALDHRDDWRGWKFESLLNPEVPGAPWKVDPRRVQNAAAQALYRHARRLFRRRPFATDSIACFVKLMQFEEDLLTSVAEGLTLGLGAKETLAMLEVNA
jgi:vacuolar-type H+-ATPase subunit C/Vma6